MDLLKKVFNLAGDLYQNRSVDSPSERPKDYEEILKLTIEEQRRVYDCVDSNYQQIKTRTIVFLGAGFAVMTFLYSSGDIFFPEQLYGRIFYFVALGLVITGFCLLFVALQTAQWEFPTEKTRLSKLADFRSRIAYLEYVKDRYLACYDRNIAICEKKHRLLSTSFYPLVIGATILVLLKIFKETI